MIIAIVDASRSGCARRSPTSQKLMPALWARSGWPYGKIPTDVAVAATDPERGLLARQAIYAEVSVVVSTVAKATGHQIKGWRALTETFETLRVERARPHLRPQLVRR